MSWLAPLPVFPVTFSSGSWIGCADINFIVTPYIHHCSFKKAEDCQVEVGDEGMKVCIFVTSL